MAVGVGGWTPLEFVPSHQILATPLSMNIFYVDNLQTCQVLFVKSVKVKSVTFGVRIAYLRSMIDALTPTQSHLVNG